MSNDTDKIYNRKVLESFNQRKKDYTSPPEKKTFVLSVFLIILFISILLFFMGYKEINLEIPVKHLNISERNSCVSLSVSAKLYNWIISQEQKPILVLKNNKLLMSAIYKKKLDYIIEFKTDEIPNRDNIISLVIGRIRLYKYLFPVFRRSYQDKING